MTMPEAAPTPAPSSPPAIAQVPHERGFCKYAQPLKLDAISAAPATPATAFKNLDFSLMNSSSPKCVYARSEPASLAPEPQPCPNGNYPTQLTGKYSYIRNKNAT